MKSQGIDQWPIPLPVAQLLVVRPHYEFIGQDLAEARRASPPECVPFSKRAKTRTPMKCEIISHFKQLIVANIVTMKKPRFFETREYLTVSF